MNVERIPDALRRPRRRARRRRRGRGRVRGLSDRAIAWLFIAPTIAAAARDQHLPADLDDPALVHQLPRQPAERDGASASASTTTCRILTDPDIWAPMQATAHFVFWTIAAADADRLRARLPDRPQVPRPRLLDHGDPDPDDAVAGGGRQLLDLPLPAADRPLQLRRLVLHRHPAVAPSRCSAP